MSESSRLEDILAADGETIALLQEEIARLEAELAAREEALVIATAPAHDDGPAPAGFDELRSELDRLNAELATRDDAINVLLEQTRLFEEAAAAQRDEWEQLTRWVEEVERRVDGRGESDARLAEALDAERRQGEDLRQQLGDERRGWEVQKASMEREAQHLRERLAATQSAGGLDATVELLERENKKLRKAIAELQKGAALAGEVEPLRQRLAAIQTEMDSVRVELRQERDERERERIESEAAIRSLRSQIAREAAENAAPPRQSEEPIERESNGENPYIQADERIRAFRQHLREVHEAEQADRAARSLAGRLSRLWRSTGPN